MLKNGEVLRSYHIGLGSNPVGHKTQEGDGKTPEGKYKINGRNPKSAYHLSLRVSYPNAEDKANAAKRDVSPGGDIMIHGCPMLFPNFGQKSF
ncbi:MAG: L,D-transpeptidase family protein [Alphaproteobacteria bacterium]|nr:L,D-transpeptidase family protein [Alphaproteobacteria bacterium]